MIDAPARGGFSAAVDPYARARPAYARRAIGALKLVLGSTRAVHVAAGTGMLTGQIHRSGLEVIAVEAAAELRANVARTLPGVATIGGAADRLPLRTGHVEAIVVDGFGPGSSPAAAMSECRRVLSEGGFLAAICNRLDTSVDWVEQLAAIVAGARPDRHNPESGPLDWSLAVAGTDGFVPVVAERHENPRSVTPKHLVDRVALDAAGAARDRRVVDQVEHLVKTHPALVGRERFELPRITELIIRRRVADG